VQLCRTATAPALVPTPASVPAPAPAPSVPRPVVRSAHPPMRALQEWWRGCVAHPDARRARPVCVVTGATGTGKSTAVDCLVSGGRCTTVTAWRVREGTWWDAVLRAAVAGTLPGRARPTCVVVKGWDGLEPEVRAGVMEEGVWEAWWGALVTRATIPVIFVARDRCWALRCMVRRGAVGVRWEADGTAQVVAHGAAAARQAQGDWRAAARVRRGRCPTVMDAAARVLRGTPVPDADWSVHPTLAAAVHEGVVGVCGADVHAAAHAADTGATADVLARQLWRVPQVHAMVAAVWEGGVRALGSALCPADAGVRGDWTGGHRCAAASAMCRVGREGFVQWRRARQMRGCTTTLDPTDMCTFIGTTHPAASRHAGNVWGDAAAWGDPRLWEGAAPAPSPAAGPTPASP
jgi:hypothetical protein